MSRAYRVFLVVFSMTAFFIGMQQVSLDTPSSSSHAGGATGSPRREGSAPNTSRGNRSDTKLPPPATTEQEGQVRSRNGADLPLRVGIFMTTHWSKEQQMYLPCWEHAMKLPILKNADLILYTPANLSREELARLHFRRITLKQFPNRGYQASAIQAVSDAFGNLGRREKWFEGYDWVIRLNLDVLIMHDGWLQQVMNNMSVDGIFHNCDKRRGVRFLHTDFFAVRPQAVNATAVESCNQSNAEEHFSCSVRSIILSKRFQWVEDAEDSNHTCRIRGVKSPVVHSHQLWRYCPDYFAAPAGIKRFRWKNYTLHDARSPKPIAPDASRSCSFASP
ncbi:unnamed protein product [Symbiodinium sp. CCMP2592]|nr:unnamed protein product [Symbiodinium sp. CCMP2592]